MRVFVACSARECALPDYKLLATNVSTMLAKNGHKLVFGGFDSGMMGKCYMTFKYEGAKVKAVAELHDAESLKDMELDAYDVAPSTFERTKQLLASSEAVIILPGGIGTLAEFFSILDEKRQKKLDTPIILFNYNNYYKTLLKFLSEAHKNNLIGDQDLKLFGIVTDVTSLELYMKNIKIKGDN